MSISYELAKKLKEAGFSQDMDVGDMFYDDEKCPTLNSYVEEAGEEFVVQSKNPIKIPTLSELIEACGKELLLIKHVFDGGLDGKEELWWAEAKNDGMAGVNPEESVAYLWLALQKRK